MKVKNFFVAGLIVVSNVYGRCNSRFCGSPIKEYM